MNRLVAMVGVGVLAVGLLGWSALGWTQPAPPGTPVRPISSGAILFPMSEKAAPMDALLGEGPARGAAATKTPRPLAPTPLAPAPLSAKPAVNTANSNAEHLTEPLTSHDARSRQEPAISLEWTGPPVAKIGQTNTYSLIVRNACSTTVQRVLVRVRIPDGVACPETAPKAVAEGKVLVWELGEMPSRQEKKLQLKLAPERTGDVMPQAWVTFTGTASLAIKVREPKLVVQAKGPKNVMIGETATFILAVSNPGDGVAERVKIRAALSDGLENRRGCKLEYEIGNLAGGETRTIAVQCASKKGGTQKCEVAAEAEGGLRCQDSTSVRISQPRLELHLSGPALRYLGRKALYTLTVGNPGDAPASNVTVCDVVPEGLKILAASDGGRHDVSTRTVSWFLGEIGPGQTHEVQLQVQAVSPGDLKHKASVLGAHGLTAESELATRVEGLSALMLEMVDTEDPIEVNSETAYEVRVANTGSKVETDIKLVAVIPDKMEFKNAVAPTPYHIEGKTIVFEPLARLAPKADAVFRINVKSLSPGIVRFKIQMTSTHLTEPVIKMEATRIYSDAP